MKLARNADITGRRFGRLVAIDRVAARTGPAVWLFQCDCGRRHQAKASYVVRGRARSCGCLRAEKVSLAAHKHGLAGTRIYNIWVSLRRRCREVSTTTSALYGDRGISVCKEWDEDFYAFRNWAVERGYSDELTIDRIDVNGNYEPGNCRWATPKIQARNRSNNRWVDAPEGRMLLREAAEIYGLSHLTLTSRLNRGWGVTEALTTPVLAGRRPAPTKRPTAAT